MTLPRQVVPGFYTITRRCTQRQFLLRPDPGTNAAFEYCLAEAAQRFDMIVIATNVDSNHHHTTIFDALGNYPAFTEHFHKMVAKVQNSLRNRSENFWSSEQVCVVRSVEPTDVMRQIVYVLTNPVKDHLVDRVRRWPGVNSLQAMLKRTVVTTRRPRHFFRSTGTMPERVDLRYVVPEALAAAFGGEEMFLGELERRIAEVEERVARERARTGRRIVGRAAVLRCSWREVARKPEASKSLRPTIAARDRDIRLAALLQRQAFVDAYREARRRWISGSPAAFPIGTYWLRRFASVPIVSA